MDYSTQHQLDEMIVLENGATAPAGIQLLDAKYDEPSRSSVAPMALGRSVLSVTGRKGRQLCDVDDAEKVSAEGAYFSVEYAESRSMFSSLVAWSAKASYGTEGAGASGRVSSVRSFRKSHKKVSLVLSVYIQRIKWEDRIPQARAEAIRILESDRDDFAQKYGDCVVKAVVLGGALTLVYNFEFNSRREAETFKASAKGSYNGASGAASFVSKTVREAKNATISVQGFCQGSTELPPVFIQSEDQGKSTGELKEEANLTNALLRYFQEFETHVTPETAVPVALHIEHQRTSVEGIDEPLDLSRFEDAMNETIRRIDDIDIVISDLEYIRDFATDWNPHASAKDIADRLGVLESQREQLEAAAKEIANLEHHNIPVARADIDPLPADWYANDLEEIFKFDMNDNNRGFAFNKILPTLQPKKPICLKYAFSRGGGGDRPGHADFSFFWKLKDGSTRMIVQKSGWQFTDRDPIPEGEFYLDPSDLASLHLQGATYDNGGLSIAIQVLA